MSSYVSSQHMTNGDEHLTLLTISKDNLQDRINGVHWCRIGEEQDVSAMAAFNCNANHGDHNRDCYGKTCCHLFSC